MRTSTLLLGAAALAAAAVGIHGQTAISAADNDVNTLQYALVLERLESGFYTAGQAKYNEKSFTDAGYTALDYAYFGLIAGHEAAHVAFLTSDAVLGANAKPACTYDLGTSLDTVTSYVQTAATLEGVGVTAYDGAVNAISNTATAQVAATIATVEARHSAYLNGLIQKVPVNGQADLNLPGGTGAVDKANTPTDVFAAAKPFVKSCPFELTSIAPQVRPGGVYTATTLSAFKPSNANPLSGTTYTQEQYDNDNTALNYALVLENLEADFYKTQQAKFSRTDFTTYFTDKGVDGGAVYDNLALIAGHESAHAAFLTSVVNTRAPGTAYAPCTYNWTAVVTDIPSYIKTAITLESTGVSAYDGAVNAFTDTGLQQAGATIATIEARHTSYLNLIAKQSGINTDAVPFPGSDGKQALDTALAPTAVLAAVGGLNVQTCKFTPATPKVAPAAPSSATSAHGGSAFALVATLLAAVVAALRM